MVSNSTRYKFPYLEKSLLVILSLLIVLSCCCWAYVPGTYYVDERGFSHGTGTESYYYPTGEIKLLEHYFAGRITSQEYYHPDGTLVATSIFSTHSGGTSYALYDDGSIRAKMPCVYSSDDNAFLVHGNATYYKPSVEVDSVISYKKGVRTDKGL